MRFVEPRELVNPSHLYSLWLREKIWRLLTWAETHRWERICKFSLPEGRCQHIIWVGGGCVWTQWKMKNFTTATPRPRATLHRSNLPGSNRSELSPQKRPKEVTSRNGGWKWWVTVCLTQLWGSYWRNLFLYSSTLTSEEGPPVLGEGGEREESR